jgi:hypothetical protein
MMPSMDTAPRQDSLPPDAAAAHAGGAPAEAAAWAEVVARWGEPAAHKAYLDRFPDLDGLAAAGRRYRAVLEARPGDAVAVAMKAEILKRATVVGLALLPRTSPPRVPEGTWKRRIVIFIAMTVASLCAWVAWRLTAGFTP